MKIEEIRGKSDVELEFVVSGMEKELFDLRFKSATQSLPDPSRIRLLRRTIARIRTVMEERKSQIRGAKAL
jgi:large subunit ribosomal protein L29